MLPPGGHRRQFIGMRHLGALQVKSHAAGARTGPMYAPRNSERRLAASPHSSGFVGGIL
jgi:hypothetical protein